MHCRLCAEPKTSKDAISFDNEETKYKEILEKLTILNAKYVDDLSNRSGISKTFCFCCCESLHKAYEFIVQVRNAQIKLDAIYPEKQNATDNVESFFNVKIEPEEYMIEPAQNISDTEVGNYEIKTEQNEYQNMISGELKDNIISNNSSFYAYNTTTNKPEKSVIQIKCELGDVLSWKDYSWTCGICFNLFPDIGSLRSHSLVEHKKCAKFACFICKETSDYNNFVVHAKSHHRSLLNRCHHCDITVEPQDLSSHINQHLQTAQTCPKCGESFVDNTSLQWHIDYIKKRKDVPTTTKTEEKITKKEESKLKIFPCPTCGKVFQRQKSLTVHKKIHGDRTRDYACTTCGNAFYSSKYLKQHIARYCYIKPEKGPEVKTPEKTIKKKWPVIKNKFCSICNKAFSKLCFLKAHMETHNTDRQRNYICEQCGNKYINKSSLLDHIKFRHPEDPDIKICRKKKTNVNTYACDICNASFKAKTNLRMHILLHSAERPYSCEICGGSYRNKKYLAQHKRAHSNPYRFKCKYCNKGFNFRGCMVKHERKHTGIKPYSCEECNKEFADWCNYNKHMKGKHNKDMAKKKINLICD